MINQAAVKLRGAIHAMIGYCSSLQVGTVSQGYIERLNNHYIPQIEAAMQEFSGNGSAPWKCRYKNSGVGGNDPQDCEWPVCGCDPYADKVIAALDEAGAGDSDEMAERVARAIYEAKHPGAKFEDTANQKHWLKIAKAGIAAMPAFCWKGWSAETPSEKVDEYNDVFASEIPVVSLAAGARAMYERESCSGRKKAWREVARGKMVECLNDAEACAKAWGLEWTA